MAEEQIWIKQVEEAVDEAKIFPLWGAPPAFPWKEFTRKLAEALHLQKLSIEIEKTEWKKADEFLAGLGASPHVTSLEFAPLTEPAFFVISAEDTNKLTSLCLMKSDTKGFSTPEFQEGFLHFLFLQALDVLDSLKSFSDLTAKLGKTSSLPKKEGGFCYDLKLTIGREALRARLIAPLAFHQAFRAHFSQHKPSLQESPLAKEPLLTLKLEIGSCDLELKKWKEIELGDLLILDRCTFNPQEQKGNATLVLGKTPLFHGRFKEGNFKLLDYAFIYEESMSPSDENEEEIKETEGEPPVEEGEHLWSSKEAGQAEIEPLLSAEKVPLPLIVEIGRLNLSVEKLLQMKPGNLLELGITPEQGVNLTVHGRRIAKGELVKIGELLGVRILEIS